MGRHHFPHTFTNSAFSIILHFEPVLPMDTLRNAIEFSNNKLLGCSLTRKYFHCVGCWKIVHIFSALLCVCSTLLRLLRLIPFSISTFVKKKGLLYVDSLRLAQFKFKKFKAYVILNKLTNH
jgi:hypothetical protein